MHQVVTHRRDWHNWVPKLHRLCRAHLFRHGWFRLLDGRSRLFNQLIASVSQIRCAEGVTSLIQNDLRRCVHRLFLLPIWYHANRLIWHILFTVGRLNWLLFWSAAQLEGYVHVWSLACCHCCHPGLLVIEGHGGVRLMIIWRRKFPSCVALVEHLEIELRCASFDHIWWAIVQISLAWVYPCVPHQIVPNDQVWRACCLDTSLIQHLAWRGRIICFPSSIRLWVLRLKHAVARAVWCLHIWCTGGLTYDVWIDRGHLDEGENVWRQHPTNILHLLLAIHH